MAEFTEVMKQKKRMCETQEICKMCNINTSNNGRNIGCTGFISDYPQEAEEIIMRWAEEHPIKTNADVFKEVFGFDINRGSGGCNGIKCHSNKICSECNYLGFWDREYKEQSNETERVVR